jgi:hypothetical protein
MNHKFSRGERIQDRTPAQEIETLEWLLNRVVSEEDYELAGTIHCKINELRQLPQHVKRDNWYFLEEREREQRM